jgi:N-acetylneuraminate lyase
MKRTEKINGLIAPVFTPMYENGDISTEIIPDYAEYLKSKGLAGIFALGSSGEGMLLTTAERQIIAEAWAPFASEDFKFIIHVGSTSYRQSRELAIHARDCGAWAVSCMGPAFLQPQNVTDLVEFCAQVASAVPELPFYYYHIPVRTGLSLSMVEFLKVADKKIPNLAGIKFTHSNFMDMQQCMALHNGKFDIMQGSDESLLCGLTLGVQGAIGTSFNFIPGLFKELIRAFNKGDITKARELQLRVVGIFERIITYRGGIVAGKAMLKIAGIDCGPCRSPLRGLTDDEFEAMKKDLEEAGLYSLFGK